MIPEKLQTFRIIMRPNKCLERKSRFNLKRFSLY